MGVWRLHGPIGQAPASIPYSFRRFLAPSVIQTQRTLRVGTTRPVHDAITYLENHRDMMDYPSARRRGLPIGSGNTEATCKTLFTVRMKRSGARWKETTAADVINLRVLALSDRLEPALQLTLAPLRKAVRAAA